LDDAQEQGKSPSAEQSAFVEIVGTEGKSTAIGPPAPPITREDLVRVFEKDYSAEDAAQLASDLTPAEPGGFWSTNILLGVADLSPEHEMRIRGYLGWSAERMARELLTYRSG
jgi:hypothetical protein